MPNFRPSSADVSSIAVWVRLNELPIEYYQVEALKEIGSTIGKVLRIDTHTSLESRGRYARICVQVDVEKPLITTLIIGNFEQSVSYEGIHKLCFSCGRIGHQKDACPHTIRPAQPPPREEADEEDKIQGSPHDRHVAESAVDKHSCTGSNQDDLYGPWMVVTRKKNGYKPARYNKNATTSRYSNEGQIHTGTSTSWIDNGKDNVRDSKRRFYLNQGSSGPQWDKAKEKSALFSLGSGQQVLGSKEEGPKEKEQSLASFSPKSISKTQVSKGKIVHSRNRASQNASKHTAGTMSQPTSSSKPEMGSVFSKYRKKSESNSCNEMMQLKAQKSLESHLPADRQDCKGSPSLDSKVEAVVALSDRCVEPGEGEKDSMEVFPSNPSVPKEKDVELSTNYGKPPLNQVLPSSSNNGGGCSSMLPYSDVRKGPDRGVVEKDGMDFDEGVVEKDGQIGEGTISQRR